MEYGKFASLLMEQTLHVLPRMVGFEAKDAEIAGIDAVAARIGADFKVIEEENARLDGVLKSAMRQPFVQDAPDKINSRDFDWTPENVEWSVGDKVYLLDKGAIKPGVVFSVVRGKNDRVDVAVAGRGGSGHLAELRGVEKHISPRFSDGFPVDKRYGERISKEK